MPIGYISSFDGIDLGRPTSLNGTALTLTTAGVAAVNVIIPLQLLVPIFVDEDIKDIVKELENSCELVTGVLADEPLKGCTLTTFRVMQGVRSARGVLSIPDSPVQIIFRSPTDTMDPLRIEMIGLENAKPSQIRAAVKYIVPLQHKVVGYVRRQDMTKEYNDAFRTIMRNQPEDQARVKKQIKGEFLAKHGRDHSKSFDEAMYRRGYKKYKKPR